MSRHAIMVRLCRPSTFRTAAATSLVVGGLVLVWLIGSGRQHGSFRIDEAHKVADTFFYRLVARGDFSDPAWFRHIVDRTNPPVPKILFGLAASIGGTPLAPDLSIRVEEPGGALGQHLRDNGEETYRHTLVAMRFVSIIATAGTAAIIFFIAIRLAGTLSALVTVFLYLTNFLTQAFSATAIADPLLTFLVLASALPLLHFWKHADRRIPVWTVLTSATVCALAFDTRATGLVALGATGLSLLILAWWRRSFACVVALVVIAVLTFTIATALNPYYWAQPRPSADVPAPFQAYQPLPVRIADRYARQWTDLQLLVANNAAGQETLDRPAEKIRFLFEMMFADWSGVLLFAGLSCTVILWGLRLTGRGGPDLFFLCWCLPIVIVVVAWIPFAWPRYLLLVVPELALIAGAWAGRSGSSSPARWPS